MRTRGQGASHSPRLLRERAANPARESQRSRIPAPTAHRGNSPESRLAGDRSIDRNTVIRWPPRAIAGNSDMRDRRASGMRRINDPSFPVRFLLKKKCRAWSLAMKPSLLTTSEWRFIRGGDGRYYTKSSYPYAYWRRLLEHFDRVTIAARVTTE